MILNVAIENFKAIHKIADFPLQSFTVFIGNNGSGKSSVVEALRILQKAINGGLNEAFKEWGGLDKVRNYNAEKKLERDNKNSLSSEPLRISLSALVKEKIYQYDVSININTPGIYYVVEYERLFCENELIFEAHNINEEQGEVVFYKSAYSRGTQKMSYIPNRLWIGFQPSYMSDEVNEFTNYIDNWQFLYLNAHIMGKPIPIDRVNRTIKLEYDGSNIADHLMWLKNQGEEYISSLIRKMQFVLPYITDLQPHVLEETINKEVELLLVENTKNSRPLPGWLLSSGTLRVLALLSVFDQPEKPPVLFIDEIENGLDPRTIGLLLSQIESVFSEKSMQVIATTHSPYFLDLVPLESIIVSEKTNEGSTYYLPKNENSLKLWKEKFSPGKLYTMGKLTN
jgi:predicted ATPase